MARTFAVYPKAVIDAAGWTAVTKVHDVDSRESWKLRHTFPAGVTVIGDQVALLKIVFIVVTDDGDTAQDIDDALFVDDIKPGPQVQTVWSNWQAAAEAIIDGLPPGFTSEQFDAEWSANDTAAMRNDGRRALVTQRGWQITEFHQHEGDGTSTDD